MPHATDEFIFERKIAAWCGKFSKTMTGNPHRAFLTAFDERGEVSQLFFAEGKILDPEKVDSFQSCNRRWLNWSPFGAPQSRSLGWQNLTREAMERLTGERFPEEDFVSDRTGKRIEFPEKWFVVF
jgi:hypothetical protein